MLSTQDSDKHKKYIIKLNTLNQIDKNPAEGPYEEKRPKVGFLRQNAVHKQGRFDIKSEKTG